MVCGPKRAQTEVISQQSVYVYNYDELDRLYRQQMDLSVNRRQDFAFDPHGNRTSKVSNVSGELIFRGFTYGSSVQSHRPTSVNIGGNVNTLTYSTDGDITQYDATSGHAPGWNTTGPYNVTKTTVGAGQASS